jgi:hypothetical protein
VSRPGGALLRLLGADPGTFRPLYRVQKLLLARRTRLMQARRRTLSISPFAILCLYAFVYGTVFVLFLLATRRAPLLGAALAVTVGCAFLLLLVVTDYFDVLVSPRDVLVLAAHPHDDRSYLLAKIAAVLRVLSILYLFLFIPPGVVAGLLWQSWLAVGAFLAGAAGAALATALCGMLFGVLLLRIGGKAAVERLLPWLQGLFQIGYLFMIGGHRLVDKIALPPSALSALLWTLPASWFLAPLEMTGRGFAPAPLVRLGLAAGTLALLLFGAVRWLGPGLSERLLEPPARAARRPRRHRTLPGSGSERARLFAILRVHLRSDWRTRSEFLLVPLMGTFLILFYLHGAFGGRSSSGMSAFFYCWMLVLSSDVLTRGSRPEGLWWILTAPIDRSRFSLATVSLGRAFHLAPLFAAIAIVEIRAGGSWAHRLARLAELLALGDLLIVLGKGIFPDFPFSRPRAEGGAAGSRAALTLVAGLVSGVATGLVVLCDWLGAPGLLIGAAVFALLHVPASLWARRRAAQAAEEIELAAG